MEKRACCAAAGASVLIVKLVLGVTQLASCAVCLPWAGLHVESHQFDHCTSVFHISVPLEDAWLILDDRVQEIHVTTPVGANDSEFFALEEHKGEPLQGLRQTSGSEVVSPHRQHVPVNRMPEYHAASTKYELYLVSPSPTCPARPVHYSS